MKSNIEIYIDNLNLNEINIKLIESYIHYIKFINNKINIYIINPEIKEISINDKFLVINENITIIDIYDNLFTKICEKIDFNKDISIILFTKINNILLNNDKICDNFNILMNNSNFYYFNFNSDKNNILSNSKNIYDLILIDENINTLFDIDIENIHKSNNSFKVIRNKNDKNINENTNNFNIEIINYINIIVKTIKHNFYILLDDFRELSLNENINKDNKDNNDNINNFDKIFNYNDIIKIYDKIKFLENNYNNELLNILLLELKKNIIKKINTKTNNDIINYGIKSILNISNLSKIKHQNKIINNIFNNINKYNDINNLYEINDKVKKYILDNEMNFDNNFNISKEFFQSFYSMSDWISELESGSCMGLFFNINSFDYTVAGFTSTSITINITYSYLSIKDYFDNLIEKMNSETSNFGNLNKKIIFNNDGIGKGNSIFPIYINYAHWIQTKKFIPYIYATFLSHNPFAIDDKHKSFPFVFLMRYFDIINDNINIISIKTLFIIFRTCYQLSKDFKYISTVKYIIDKFLKNNEILYDIEAILGELISSLIFFDNNKTNLLIKKILEQIFLSLYKNDPSLIHSKLKFLDNPIQFLKDKIDTTLNNKSHKYIFNFLKYSIIINNFILNNFTNNYNFLNYLENNFSIINDSYSYIFINLLNNFNNSYNLYTYSDLLNFINSYDYFYNILSQIIINKIFYNKPSFNIDINYHNLINNIISDNPYLQIKIEIQKILTKIINSHSLYS